MFETDFRYYDRASKAEYVWRRYQALLRDTVLDVGADQCSLKKWLPAEVGYQGVGFGDHPDLLRLDLEREPLPFPEQSFDCVLCLDVLEHLENVQDVFDQLCRLSKRYVIITLPNPWGDLFTVLRYKSYRPEQPFKFYGLPVERQEDRHKWFFSYSEGEAFIRQRAALNGLRVVELAPYNRDSLGWGWSGWLRRQAMKLLFRGDLNQADLFNGTIWAVLERPPVAP